MKKCNDCGNKWECWLYLSEYWKGEKEAEYCRTYVTDLKLNTMNK